MKNIVNSLFSTFVTDNDISSIGSNFRAMTPDSIALAEYCEDQKVRGPLLIIASSLTVSEDALSWEKVLGTLSISYRVLVFSENSENEIHEIQKEATDFQATTLAAIGTQKILTVVESAASLLNLQLVTVLHESH